MEREVLEEGHKTEEGRLKIKKIKKYNAADVLFQTSALLNEFLVGACAIGGLYSFYKGVQGKYFCDSSLMTYGACFLAIIIGAFSGATVPWLRDKSYDYREKVELLKKEILESKKENVR